MTALQIREMEPFDIHSVLAVEKATYKQPWPADIFYRELVENTYAHYFVLTLDDRVIGYGGMWLVTDDGQITNIAISPEYRGNKYGKKLFEFMMQYGMRFGMKRLSLEVRKSNIVAQRMYETFGLVRGGVRKNYYTDDQEDAIVMWLNIE